MVVEGRSVGVVRTGSGVESKGSLINPDTTESNPRNVKTELIWLKGMVRYSTVRSLGFSHAGPCEVLSLGEFHENF